MTRPSDALAALAARGPLRAWDGDDKIPWNEPGFSARMLREHLSQAHDAASRRAPAIEGHVAWLHAELLHATPGRVLDLGCGPGLYTSRLARLGHRCTGIDFSPAAIAHARAEAAADGLACAYIEGDLRAGGFGSGFDLALFASGELNAFRPDDALRILRAARAALAPAGALALEVHTFESLERRGRHAPSWYAAPSGLFSERPHLCLREFTFDAPRRAAVSRSFVIDAASGALDVHRETLQAYTDDAYQELLDRSCFAPPTRFASLAGGSGPGRADFQVLVSRPA